MYLFRYFFIWDHLWEEIVCVCFCVSQGTVLVQTKVGTKGQDDGLE